MIRRIFLLAALALAGCRTEHVVHTKIVKGTAVDHGEALFSDEAASPSTLNDFSCATCHQAKPDPSDPRILPGAPLAGAPLRPLYWGGQENDLLRSINDCRFYFMEAQQPWAADDTEAEALYAYLTSLSGGSTDPVPFTVVGSIEDLDPGDAKVGQDVFDRACKECHGAIHTGEGRLTARAPKLPDQTLAEHAGYTADEKRVVFIEKVRHGGFLGYGGNMPPFSTEVLSDAELAALLSYLDLYAK